MRFKCCVRWIDFITLVTLSHNQVGHQQQLGHFRFPRLTADRQFPRISFVFVCVFVLLCDKRPACTGIINSHQQQHLFIINILYDFDLWFISPCHLSCGNLFLQTGGSYCVYVGHQIKISTNLLIISDFLK
jgi:hypothetical protein